MSDVAAAMGPALIHPTALVYGKVSIGEGSSLWPYVVMRAESDQIRIGRFTNIQDFSMLHVCFDLDVVVGDYCSITHRCTLHACVIGHRCLIGIGATIMDGCVIGDDSIVAGHSFLKEGTIVPPRSIVMGTPAKVVRQRDCAVPNVANALLYHRNALAYARGEHRAWENIDQTAIQAAAAAIAAER